MQRVWRSNIHFSTMLWHKSPDSGAFEGILKRFKILEQMLQHALHPLITVVKPITRGYAPCMSKCQGLLKQLFVNITYLDTLDHLHLQALPTRCSGWDL